MGRMIDDLSRVRERLSEGFQMVARILGDPERTGVYASFADAKGNVEVTLRVEKPNPERAPKYHSCAYEKAERLGKHPDHLTSDQSANESQGQYGGGFRLNKCGPIVAVSGLPTANADQAVGLYAMMRSGYMDPNFAEEIAQSCHNGVWNQLMDQAVG